jgi:hypothetical protein
LSELLREIASLIKDILSIVHWISTITLIAGLAAVAGSFEETMNFILLKMIVPSIFLNILTGVLMEILETRFPSIYRLLRRVLS